MAQFFKKRKKPYFGVTFVQRKFSYDLWLCTPARVTQHLNVEDTEQTGHETKNYSININMQELFNQSAQFIKLFVRYTWFKSPLIYKVSPIFDCAHPIIIKVTINFPKFVSAHKKSDDFINSFLK